MFKIPSVNTYTVSVSNISGYLTPARQSYTAGVSTSRNVIMSYIKVYLGIYIYDTDGQLTLPENWDTANNSKAVGVYVGTENSQFVIAPSKSSSKLKWGGYGTIPGIVTSGYSAEALKDYAGASNTDAIITELGAGKCPAAYYCRNYIFNNGKSGYLWSLGEANDAFNNITEIEDAMRKIGGDAIGYLSYWTSTQRSEQMAWKCSRSSGTLSTDKTDEEYVRAVCSI